MLTLYSLHIGISYIGKNRLYYSVSRLAGKSCSLEYRQRYMLIILKGLWAVIECMVALMVGCIPAISQLFRGIGGSSHHAESDPYEQQQANRSAGDPASWPGRGRKSHLSATPAAFSSEENLFDDGRQKTDITVTNNEIELGELRRGRT
jgi:hypothetical protein